MGWLDVRLGSFTPSLVVLIALLAANCLVFMRLEEIPLHSPGWLRSRSSRIDSRGRRRSGRSPSEYPATLDQADRDGDHGQHDKDMDETTERGAGDEPKGPQDKQNNRYGPQHDFHLSVCRNMAQC